MDKNQGGLPADTRSVLGNCALEVGGDQIWRASDHLPQGRLSLGELQPSRTRLSSPQEPNFTSVKWKKMLIAAILFIVRLHLPVFVVCKQAEFSTNCSVC